MRSQQCGCRIKTYSSDEGNGEVRNITWQDIVMTETEACVTVDASYHPPPPPPVRYFINVSDIRLVNVHGSGCGSSSHPAAQFNCPAEAPCTGIVLTGVHLDGGSRTAKMDCAHAYGTATDTVPTSCLQGSRPPSPPSPPTPGCDVDGCFARCLNKYGGTIEGSDEAYYCSKGCAGMDGGKVKEKQKFCRVAASRRFQECDKECDASSGNKTRVSCCKYGCEWWENATTILAALRIDAA